MRGGKGRQGCEVRCEAAICRPLTFLRLRACSVCSCESCDTSLRTWDSDGETKEFAICAGESQSLLGNQSIPDLPGRCTYREG